MSLCGDCQSNTSRESTDVEPRTSVSEPKKFELNGSIDYAASI